jgi:hypothetical protein
MHTVLELLGAGLVIYLVVRLLVHLFRSQQGEAPRVVPRGLHRRKTPLRGLQPAEEASRVGVLLEKEWRQKMGWPKAGTTTEDCGGTNTIGSNANALTAKGRPVGLMDHRTQRSHTTGALRPPYLPQKTNACQLGQKQAARRKLRGETGRADPPASGSSHREAGSIHPENAPGDRAQPSWSRPRRSCNSIVCHILPAFLAPHSLRH